MSDECAIRLEDCPPPTRRVILGVGSETAELKRGAALSLEMAAIEVALHGDEPKAANAFGTDLDEGWTEKVTRFLVPTIHLYDLPAACRSPARSTPPPFERRSVMAGRLSCRWIIRAMAPREESV